MAEADLLHRLQETFNEYVSTPEEISNIRDRIASHLQDCVGDNLGQIPQHVQGLRRHFLQATYANQRARRRLQDLQQLRKTPAPIEAKETVFANHLEVLNLRRQYQNYQAISHHASRLESISETHRPLEDQTKYEISTQGDNVGRRKEAGSDVEDRIKSLEMALLKTNYQLQRERHLLEQVKSNAIDGRTSETSRLFALEATRTELTGWVEDSLAKCDLAQPTDHPRSIDSTEIGDQPKGNDIDEAYMQYCDARLQLLSSLDSLSQPLPTIDNTQQIQQNTVHLQPNIILPAIEASYLPHWTANSIVHQQLQFLSELIKDDDQQLTEKLHRLQDESHLLPAYPILSKTHQRSRSTVDSTTTQPDHARMLEAWRFANEAAQITTSETVLKQSSEGHEANETSAQILDFLKHQSDLWHQVD